MRRIVLEAALATAAEGSRRLEIQVDPTSYAPFVGGITPALEIILDAAKQATTLSGVEVAVIVAAPGCVTRWTPVHSHAWRCATPGDQPGEVIGFGLSNDERAGRTSSWERAFAIARRGGLASMPHGGELLGPDHLREVVSALGPRAWATVYAPARTPPCWTRLSPSGIQPRGLPGLQREPGRLSQPRRRPAAHAHEPWGADRPERRRPPALPVPARQPVRDRPDPGLHRRRAG